MNYYNEFDPKAAAWLRELIKEGHIPPGDVDERSIVDVKPHELTHYIQKHFFAGVGGWSLAFRLAGWPDDKPATSLSCPCQPFSQTGLGLGEQDPRHLYPVASKLIEFGKRTITFGEQVASAAGRVWLARVRADLERMGYGVGAADLCSASACPEVAGWICSRNGESRVPVSAGPPNIRQRLYWVAHPGHQSTGRGADAGETSGGRSFGESPGRGSARGLADTDGGKSSHGEVQRGDPHRAGSQGRDERGHRAGQRPPWASSVVLPCTDGKARRIEPGSFPLAHGIPGRVGLLRGFGNAINPWLAAEFIQASQEDGGVN